MTFENDTRHQANDAVAAAPVELTETAETTDVPQDEQAPAVEVELQPDTLEIEALLAMAPVALTGEAAAVAIAASSLAPGAGGEPLSGLMPADAGGSSEAASPYNEDGFGNLFGANPRGPFEGLPQPGLEIPEETQMIIEEDPEPEAEEPAPPPPYTPPTIDPDDPCDPDDPDDPDYPDYPDYPDDPQDPDGPLDLIDLLPPSEVGLDLPPDEPRDEPGDEPDCPPSPTPPVESYPDNPPIESLTDLVPFDPIDSDPGIAA